MAGVRATAALVGLHYLVNLAHGVAHGGVPVPLTPFQTAFVVIVVGFGPLVGVWLSRSDRPTLAWGSLAAVLAAGFVFGVAFHYVIASPDHVANVPAGSWKLPFEGTAALVALVDGGGALVAAWFWMQTRRFQPTTLTDSTT